MPSNFFRAIGVSANPLRGLLAVRARDFAHPREVVLDEDLDPAQKRAILAAWASDACAVESRPGFRWLPGTPGPIAFRHIAAAIRALDSGDAGWGGRSYRSKRINPPKAHS
jgi:hypothetical protein